MLDIYGVRQHEKERLALAVLVKNLVLDKIDSRLGNITPLSFNVCGQHIGHLKTFFSLIC